MLILANIVPIIGTLYFEWAPMDIIFIYWLETLFIGFFTIIKMIFAPREKNIIRFFTIPFFILFYGGFQAVQGFFILIILPNLILAFTGEYNEIATVGYVEYLFWPALALFLSHLFSLIWNFFLRKEFMTSKISKLFSKPMKRVVIQQIIVVGGCCLLMRTKSTVLLVVLVILVKTFFDLKEHIKSHLAAQEVEPGSA